MIEAYHNIRTNNWRRSLQTHAFNTLRPRQNDRHFPDDIFKWIFLNEDIWISLKISLKFVPNVRINNIPSLVQVMACRLPDPKPLYEPMMVKLLTHIHDICVSRVKICHMNTGCIKHQSFILSSVCLRWSTFSLLSELLCNIYFSVSINYLFDDCENRSTLSYYLYHMGNMNHWSLFIMKHWDALCALLCSYWSTHLQRVSGNIP